jgi:hypothetical protein
MSQHDLDVINDSGSAVRADLNLALKALGSMMTGARGSMPDTQVNQLVADTTSGHIIKRNNSDTDWDYIMPIDHSLIASTVGTASYAIAYSPAIDAYKNGVVYHWRADVSNTGTTTISINSLAAKTIKRYIGGSLVAVSDNDIIANQFCRTLYDSLNDAMILLSPNQSIIGTIRQIVYHSMATGMSGTTAFPNCITSSIPQNTEGDQYLSASITPTNANNFLKIDVCLVATSYSSDWYSCGAALFKTGTANALCSIPFLGVVNFPNNVVFSHYMLADTTSSITFTVRAGTLGGGAYPLHVNKRFYGGTAYTMGATIRSTLTITEFEA